MADFDTELERAQADGRITVGDADEVRRFGEFLSALGPKDAPDYGQRVHAAMHEHYPDDLRRARMSQGLPPECCGSDPQEATP